ncbi:MAG: cation transporter [Thermomicrobiales bacterium]|nr:cation transporter [Thermomicrobiales bacterium]
MSAQAAFSDHSSHNHDHVPHESGRANPRPLAIALGITAAFTVVEAVGGLLTGSLALLADAAHMLTDVGALALALAAIWLARRPPTPQRSFGFARAEVLAALINSAVLVAVTGWLFWEVIQRLNHPPEVDSGPMLIVAVAGLLANAASAWTLSRGGGHQHDLNTRGAFLHVIGDLLGSVAAIVAALVMLATGWWLADPILSAGIGLLVLISAWRLLRESTEVLLEATPTGIDPAEVASAMASAPGVIGVHDLHIWTVTSGLVALSAHVELADGQSWPEALTELNRRLRPFGIVHATLQPEPASDIADPFRGCTLDSPEGRAACRASHESDAASRTPRTGDVLDRAPMT